LQDWSIRSGEAEGAAVMNCWNPTVAPAHPYYELLVASCGAEVTLSRRVSVSPRTDQLVLDVERPHKGPPSKIEVRVDGHRLKEFEVRANNASRVAVQVSLQEYAGQEITLELVQRSKDPAAAVAWKKAEFTGAGK
jgi:hypothetical protein